MKAALHNYHARMQRVLDHIDRHLDDELDLDAVSGVAAFSKYHFHRQFTATFGLSSLWSQGKSNGLRTDTHVQTGGTSRKRVRGRGADVSAEGPSPIATT